MGWRLHGLQAVGRAKIRTQNAPSTKRSSFSTLWVLDLSRASAQLAAYLEPREHGAASPVSHIREAVEALHASAEALATVFTVNLAGMHQARLEALLGAPLPASLVEEGQKGRAMARRV